MSCCGGKRIAELRAKSDQRNITVTTLAPVPAPAGADLVLAAERVAELKTFTPHLLPPEYDYDRVEQALRDLAEAEHAVS